MKLAYPAVITLLLLVVSCTKDSGSGSGSACIPDMKGNWNGFWGDNFNNPANTYNFELLDAGVAKVNNGSAVYTGAWSVTDFTLSINYQISGETLVIKCPVSRTRLEGTWRNISSGIYHGTFYAQKQ